MYQFIEVVLQLVTYKLHVTISDIANLDRFSYLIFLLSLNKTRQLFPYKLDFTVYDVTLFKYYSRFFSYVIFLCNLNETRQLFPQKVRL